MSQRLHFTQIKVIAMKSHLLAISDPFWKAIIADSPEPYRAIVDCGRSGGLHSIKDGSEDYAYLVDCLEQMVVWNDYLEANVVGLGV